MIDLFPNFVRFMKDESEEIVGRDALVQMHAQVSAQAEKAGDHMQPFAMYGFLLNQDEKKKVQEWTAALASSVAATRDSGKVAPRAPASSSGECRPVPKAKAPAISKKGSEEQILRASMKALFKKLGPGREVLAATWIRQQ